jgi:hypothetical protein
MHVSLRPIWVIDQGRDKVRLAWDTCSKGAGVSRHPTFPLDAFRDPRPSMICSPFSETFNIFLASISERILGYHACGVDDGYAISWAYSLANKDSSMSIS